MSKSPPFVQSGHSQPPGWEVATARARPCAPSRELPLELHQSQLVLRLHAWPSTERLLPTGEREEPPKTLALFPHPAEGEDEIGRAPESTQPSCMGSGGGVPRSQLRAAPATLSRYTCARMYMCVYVCVCVCARAGMHLCVHVTMCMYMCAFVCH